MVVIVLVILLTSFSNTADEIKSIDQAVEYILAQSEGKWRNVDIEEKMIFANIICCCSRLKDASDGAQEVAS